MLKMETKSMKEHELNVDMFLNRKVRNRFWPKMLAFRNLTTFSLCSWMEIESGRWVQEYETMYVES